MQYLKALTTTILIMAATIANAQGILFKQATPNHLTTGPIVLTIHAKSEKIYHFTSYSNQFYSGSSQTAPCSDLNLWVQDDNHWTTLRDDTVELFSDDIVYHFGRSATCIKEDIIWRGNSYSTGNIQVLWDESTSSYIAATPDKVIIDFDKSGVPVVPVA
jgi:hypothetical protein